MLRFVTNVNSTVFISFGGEVSKRNFPKITKPGPCAIVNLKRGTIVFFQMFESLFLVTNYQFAKACLKYMNLRRTRFDLKEFKYFRISCIVK